jgi:hypothetical protein
MRKSKDLLRSDHHIATHNPRADLRPRYLRGHPQLMKRVRVQLIVGLLAICSAHDLRAERTRPAPQTNTPITIDGLHVQVGPALYETIRRPGPVQDSITGWLIVVTITNETAEWRNLVIPVKELRLTSSDGQAHVYAARAIELTERLLTLQGVQSYKLDLANARPVEGSAISGDGFELSFSPPGKNPKTDPHTARLFDITDTWRLELAGGQVFRVPLLFDCPEDSRPVTISWPKLGTFKLRI